MSELNFVFVSDSKEERAQATITEEFRTAIIIKQVRSERRMKMNVSQQISHAEKLKKTVSAISELAQQMHTRSLFSSLGAKLLRFNRRIKNKRRVRRRSGHKSSCDARASETRPASRAYQGGNSVRTKQHD